MLTRRRFLGMGLAVLPTLVLVRNLWAAVIATDTFTRANETPLASPWTQLSAISGSTLNLSSNTVVPAAVGSNTHYYYSSGTFPNDQYSQATIAATGGGASQSSGPGVMVRASGTNNGYIVNFNKAASNNVSLIKYVAGTPTIVWIRTQAWTNGDTVRFEVVGTTLRVFRQGVQIGADATDSSLTSGRPGLTYFSEAGMSAISIDNWEGGDFATGTTKRRALWY